MILYRFLRFHVFSLSILVLTIAALSSGCMWGVARDVDTGKPLVGAKVTLIDSQGQTLVATTDERGIFGFGAPSSAAPALGQAQVKVEAAGYDTLSDARQMAYDDNPFATFADPSSFWEVQAFALAKPGVSYHNEAGNFSLLLPAGWDVKDNFFGAGSVLAIPPSDYVIFPADVGVGGTDLASGRTLDNWVDDTATGVCSVTTDCHVLEKRAATIDGVAAMRTMMSYTVTPESSEPGLFTTGQQLQELAYFVVKGHKGYILDFTATQANFPTLQNRFEQIAQSFKFD